MTGGYRLELNAIRCDGHGHCAEMLPELIELDEWGYPIIAAAPVPFVFEVEARKTVAACPALALTLRPV